MKFILESNGIISDIQDGASLEAKQKEFPTYHIMDCPDNFTGARGDDVKLFNKDFTRKKTSSLVKDGTIKLPETHKLDGETIREKTQIEKYADGTDKIPSGLKLNKDKTAVISKTLAEKVVDGEMTQEEADTANAELLENSKTQKKAEIKSSYEVEKTTSRKGIMSATLGVKIDCRDIDYDQTQALVLYLEAKGLTYTNKYKVFDNTYITATAEQLKSVLSEIVVHQVELWGKKDSLLNEINSSASLENVESISW